MERREFVKVAGLAAIGVIGIPVGAAGKESQGGWRWCKKCEGLWFADGGDDRKGKCPAGGTHTSADSGSYVLTQNDDNAAGQQGWRWCKKCEGLWFGDGGENRKGKCPGGGTHELADSGNYALTHNDDNAAGQQGWRWCKKCEGLWFADGGEARKGRCPAGETHTDADSGRYAVVQE
jgi:hypothetical protein